MKTELKAYHDKLILEAVRSGKPVMFGEWRGGKVREQGGIDKKTGKPKVTGILEGTIELATADDGKPMSFSMTLWDNSERGGDPLPVVQRRTEERIKGSLMVGDLVLVLVSKFDKERAGEFTAHSIKLLPDEVPVEGSAENPKPYPLKDAKDAKKA